jgi:hypothetical protein
MLRFDSPVLFTRRIAADDLMVGDAVIPAGRRPGPGDGWRVAEVTRCCNTSVVL